MTNFHTLLDSITDQDMENPVIADLVLELYDPSVCSDEVELAAAKELNDCLMAMVEEEKAKQDFTSSQLADPDELAGVDTGTSLPYSPDCDLFNSVSKVEIQKDKKVAVCDFTPADAGQTGRGQQDGKEVAPPLTSPVATTRAILGDVVWMQVQLWDNSDKNRCVKYYSKYVIKKCRPSGKLQINTLYLNFTTRRSYTKNYKKLLTYRHETNKPVAQFYDMWRRRHIEEQKVVTATREPLIGIAMSDPKKLSTIDYVEGKSQFRVTTKNGKEVRNDYWPGYVGILFWDEYDNPHIWLGIHGRGEMLFPLIDGKHAADWEPRTEAQRHYGHRPCDFIGFWHQGKAEDEILLEKVRQMRERKK